MGGIVPCLRVASVSASVSSAATAHRASCDILGGGVGEGVGGSEILSCVVGSCPGNKQGKWAQQLAVPIPRCGITLEQSKRPDTARGWDSLGPSLERRKEKDERVFGLTTKSNSSGHRHLFKGKRTDRPALAPPHLLIYSPHSCSFRRRSEQTPSLPETGRGRLVGLSPDGIFPHIRDAGRRPRWAAACRKLHVACHFLGAV